MKKQTETEIQIQIIQWCRQFAWGQYIYHIPNESVGGMGWTVRNRQMGMRKGVPDLCLPIPMNGYHGLYIELKTITGRASAEQKRWIEALNTFGYKACICKGFNETISILKEYMNES